MAESMLSFQEVAGNSTKKRVFWKEITLSTGTLPYKQLVK